ncbi:hypothetical protein BPOR_0058g00050 [Botrytis porri]|uniref:Uncharacterized protein n=1 Tax=Botrytis porri TaxID=87229 RepID=A0A4Z1L1L1_9HELO|nr:hypothetical protein BPOR_0058g00050 [Botrytis porri]
MHYQNFLIATLAIAAPVSLALPLADPEPAKGEQQDGQDYATKTGKGKSQRDVEELENRDVADLDWDWDIKGKMTDMNVELEERAEGGKPTGGFTGNPDPAPAPNAAAKPTQHFTGKPDTEPAQTATAKPTQHFTGKPDGPEQTAIAKPTENFSGKPDGPDPTATGKPTQHCTEKPDTPPTKTIKTIEPVKTSIAFTDKPESVPRTFTSMYNIGGQATSRSVLVNTYGPASSSVIVAPVPIGTGKPAGGRGF